MKFRSLLNMIVGACVIGSLGSGLRVYAGNSPVADYMLSDPVAMGQVQGPVETGDKYPVSSEGRPRYMNLAYPGQEGRSMMFDGSSSYASSATVAELGGGFILEAWCQAKDSTSTGLSGVAALGDGTGGYSLVQNKSQWGVFVGGRGFTAAAPVAAGEWIHLALVVPRQGVPAIYVDGVKKATTYRASAIKPGISIGDMGHRGKEQFTGHIGRVRLGQLKGSFNPENDLLITTEIIEKKEFESAADARNRIARITSGLPVVTKLNTPRSDGDWLVTPVTETSSLQVLLRDNGTAAELVLANGLITRSFYLGRNLVCYSLRQEASEDEFLRSIKPEATLTIGGRNIAVGGMRFPSLARGSKGRRSSARSKYVANYFLQSWLSDLVGDPNAFVIKSITTCSPTAWLKWSPSRKRDAAAWPPKGLRVNMTYAAPATRPDLKDLEVTVHYEIYDGIPVIGKWLSFEYKGERAVTLERTLIEELAVADEYGNKIFIESELNHFHATPTRWFVDPEFKTDSGPVYTERMSDYRLRYWSQQELKNASTDFGPNPEWGGTYSSRSLLQVQYPEGPAKEMKKDMKWSTFRSWILLHDSMDEDRKGLGRRKLYRTIMPWTSENEIYMHVMSHDSKSIRQAVDQAAACNFDMIVLTHGSKFNMMSKDKRYRDRIKADFEYAHSKGIKTGAYILFCSSRGYHPNDNVSPPAYGRSLCLGSAFADRYFKQIIDFMKYVKMDCIETDGPYHGYRCEKTNHPYHKGRDDSWRVNWEQQEKFYRMCMDEGIYIITPDWYFASGGRKTPMGYKEANWTLPREQQALVARQNIYDGTWWRTPSMCYHALPLVPVYGGGPESVMHPLSKYLKSYDRVLAQYFGMGIAACYRGYQLYDTPETHDVVKGWMDFYERHYPIVSSDIIHVRRPDGRNLDCMMHANSQLEEKGLAFIFNPSDKPVSRDYELPLYYTGIKVKAEISIQDSYRTDGEPKLYNVSDERKVTVPVTVPANGYIWLLIKDGAGR